MLYVLLEDFMCRAFDSFSIALRVSISKIVLIKPKMLTMFLADKSVN